MNLLTPCRQYFGLKSLGPIRNIAETATRSADWHHGICRGREGAESKGAHPFLLRVPAPVHQALALKARAAGKSLNAYCAEKLATL